MSTWVERVRREPDADGFTLIEVVVAMILVAIVATAFVPLLVASVRATQLSKLNTTAKNLNQLRLDAMRNLTFHVDAQNGAYVDLLDYYYHDLNTSPTTLPYSITGSPTANCTVTGQWVNSGTPPVGAPPLPYYQTTFSPVCGFPSTGGQTIPAAAGFTQTVYTQFLTSSQPTPGVVPASTLSALSYNSQVSGSDAPLSLAVGVTVITSWAVYGGTHTYRSYTEITNTGNDSPLISSAAKAAAVQIDSHAEDQSILEMGVGVVQETGSLSSLSSVNVHALGAYAKQAGVGDIYGEQQTIAAPPDPTSVVDLSGAPQATGSTGCGGGGWAQFGTTYTRNVSATTSGGLPMAPATGSGQVTAELDANGGGPCAGLAFSNQLAITTASDPMLQLSPTNAMVQVADPTGSGPEMSGTASITASSASGALGAVTSTASTASVTYTAIFPGLPFVTTGVSTCGAGFQPCGRGLVNVFLSGASLQCQSGGASAGTYTGYVTYFTQTGWHSVTVNWNGAQDTDPLTAISLSQQVGSYAGAPVLLSNYISSWSTQRQLTTTSGGATGNESELAAAVAITTAPTRVNDAGSQIGVQIGQLGCTATDNR